MAEKEDRACLAVLAFLHGALLLLWLEPSTSELVSHSAPGIFQGLAPDGDC